MDDTSNPARNQTTGRWAWLDEPVTFRNAILAVVTWLVLDGGKMLVEIVWRLH